MIYPYCHLSLRKLATGGCCRPKDGFLFSLIYSYQRVAIRLVVCEEGGKKQLA